MCKQSVLLITVMVLIGSVGEVSSREVEVKAGNVQVSVQNGEVEVNMEANSLKTPSLLERLTNFSLFNRNSGSASRTSGAKCDHSFNSEQTRRTTSSGISQTSSSSTTMVCQ